MVNNMTSFRISSPSDSCKNCGGILARGENPFNSQKPGAIPIIGVFVSWPMCQHCLKDDRYLNETPGMQMVHQLRAEYQAGNITHLEFVMSEIEQIGEFLSIHDDSVIPEKIREEVFAYLDGLAKAPQTRQSEIEDDRHLLNIWGLPPEQPPHVPVPIDQYLSNWAPSTETSTVAASWSSVIQLIPESDLPPLTAMWRRYMDLKNPKDLFGRVMSYEDAYPGGCADLDGW